MNDYVAAGYLVTAVALVAYSWRILHRSRRLTRTLPEEEQTWP